jgi:hypothetical protein
VSFRGALSTLAARAAVKGFADEEAVLAASGRLYLRLYH